MSFEEKRTWIYGIVSAVVCGTYFAIILGETQGTAVAEIDYVQRLLITIGISVGVQIAANILAAIAAPEDAGVKDERDTHIDRKGEYVGGLVFAVVSLLPFGLTMARVEHFWIAHAVFAAYVLAALTTATVKIVTYRRGF